MNSLNSRKQEGRKSRAVNNAGRRCSPHATTRGRHIESWLEKVNKAFKKHARSKSIHKQERKIPEERERGAKETAGGGGLPVAVLTIPSSAGTPKADVIS